jgi:serine/threonine protein kinase/tetratricopeptide (TPR) repeat protein
VLQSNWLPLALSPGARLGPYEIVAAIGAGGMGEVYKARDTRLDRTVAIKVLPPDVSADPDRRARFEREAKIIAGLNHPHICTLYDVGRERAVPAPLPGPQSSSLSPDEPVQFLVMEHLVGDTLAERLRTGSLPLGHALEIATEIADALAAAHRQGVVHRDLKPGNVMLTTGRGSSPQVKLLDFGLAKLHPPGGDAPAGDSALTTRAPLTSGSQIAGTLPYMAPEQLEGKPTDARTDLFAFGCVLYEMVTGRRAFRGDSQASVISAIMMSDPPPISASQPLAPPLLDRLVRTCLAKRPDERWDSAHDVTEQLRAISASVGAVPAPLPPSTVRGRLWTRHPVVLAGAAALVVVAVVAAVVAPRVMRRAPVAAPGAPPSVVALPCKVYGAPDLAFLADAVPATISTLLSGVDGLDTKSPPSSLDVDPAKVDLARLAALYQVSSFIITSVTTAPGRFALNVQLVDAATKKVRWGEQYEGPRDAYNDLALRAAEGVRQAVRPSAAPVPAARVSSQAELAFREGTYLQNRYNNFHDQRDFDLSLAAFRRALDLAPGVADAAGEIAMLYVYRFESGTMAARETIPAIERWASQGLASSPCAVRSLSALCAVELERPVQSSRKMVEYGLKAASCGPADGRAQFFLGYGADAAGLTSVAIAAYLESHRLDPLYVYAPYSAALWLRELGRPEEALRLLDQELTMERDMPILLIERAADLVEVGRLAEAETVLAPLEARADKDKDALLAMWTPMVRSALSLASGNRRGADAALARVFTLTRGEEGTGYVRGMAAQYVAPALARQGRVTEAVDILQRAAAVGAAVPYEFLVRNRDLAPLGGDARLPVLLAQSKVEFDEARGILEQARARHELPAYVERPLDEAAHLPKRN